MGDTGSGNRSDCGSKDVDGEERGGPRPGRQVRTTELSDVIRRGHAPIIAASFFGLLEPTR